jgi:ATP-binding cassette subfamily F protein 3
MKAIIPGRWRKSWPGWGSIRLTWPVTREFSGGYQVRLNLAKVLVGDPDLLLLDEPTNYLDIASIRWIQRFLCAWNGEVLLITHDRGFMDAVVTHVVGIHRHKARKIEGDTGKYYECIARDEEIYEKTRLNSEKKRKEIELFISRFRAKARLANLVQSRVKTLAKMEKKDKLTTIDTLDFSFRHQPFKAKQMMTIRDLSFAYDGKKPVIDGLDLTVNDGDRICIVGKNGRGKTTLVKLLAEKLTPQQGRIGYHAAVARGFYEQTNVESLMPDRTVEDEVLYSDVQVDRQVARNICGAMMFSGDDALKKISVLSGGEKSRVMLAKLLVTPLNLLLLDEPTNHLDMDSCDALLAAIDDFPGAVIMVTHNEMFLRALAHRLIVFQHGTVEVFEGGYERFLEKGGWQDDGDGGQGRRRSRKLSGQDRDRLKKERASLVRQRSRKLGPLEKKIIAAEEAIEGAELRMSVLNDQMVAASAQQDGKRIAELGRKIHTCEETIEASFATLEELTAEKEKIGADLTAKIDRLEAALCTPGDE